VSKRRRSTSQEAVAVDRTPILDETGRRIGWRPGPAETEQRERELAAVVPTPADYVSSDAYVLDCLHDETLAALNGRELLSHYEAHRPDAILDDEGARWQAWLRGYAPSA
jgi:hypothetical protein